MKFSLVIPTFNRVNESIEAFSSVLDHPSIDEVVLVDDGSNSNILNLLKTKLQQINNPKIRLVAHPTNIGAFHNKARSVKEANNDWVILLDSDNKINASYIETLERQNLTKGTLYQPTKASNNSFRYGGINVDKEKFKELLSEISFEVMMNTGNFCCNKEDYLNAYSSEAEYLNPWACDVIYMHYLLFKHNPHFTVLPVDNLHYEHRHSKDSFYIRTEFQSQQFLKQLKHKIKTL